METRDERSITIPRQGGPSLAGVLHRPPGPHRGVALFAHRFTRSRDLRVARRISASLASKSIATLRFDFTGAGRSEEESAESTSSSHREDLVAVADWLRAQVAAPSILVGHGLGGAAVLGAAHRIEEVRAVATVGAPADPVELFGDGAGSIGALKRALLILHSPQDGVVGIENAARIFQAARHPKSFVSLDGADHRLTDEADAAYVADVIAAWAGRYIEAEATTVPRGQVVVEGRGSYRQHVQAGPHALVADEPPDIGTDEGPTPYDLLLAALGTCTSMTLRMYADRKDIPLEAVRVTLSHERIHAEDCADCETEEGRIDVIERHLELQGSLDEGQRRRLIEIADRCPVHRTLSTETKIRSNT